jgi:hypothetical protein
MGDNEDRRAFEDLVGRLGDMKEGGTFVNISWDEADDAWAVDSNAEDQDELVAAISWVLYQFATGFFEYCPDDK